MKTLIKLLVLSVQILFDCIDRLSKNNKVLFHFTVYDLDRGVRFMFSKVWVVFSASLMQNFMAHRSSKLCSSTRVTLKEQQLLKMKIVSQF